MALCYAAPCTLYLESPVKLNSVEYRKGAVVVQMPFYKQQTSSGKSVVVENAGYDADEMKREVRKILQAGKLQGCKPLSDYVVSMSRVLVFPRDAEDEDYFLVTPKELGKQVPSFIPVDDFWDFNFKKVANMHFKDLKVGTVLHIMEHKQKDLLWRTGLYSSEVILK